MVVIQTLVMIQLVLHVDVHQHQLHLFPQSHVLILAAASLMHVPRTGLLDRQVRQSLAQELAAALLPQVDHAQIQHLASLMDVLPTGLLDRQVRQALAQELAAAVTHALIQHLASLMDVLPTGPLELHLRPALAQEHAAHQAAVAPQEAVVPGQTSILI